MNLDKEKRKELCSDHQVQYQGGDPNRSFYGCDNCEADSEILPEDCGSGA